MEVTTQSEPSIKHQIDVGRWIYVGIQTLSFLIIYYYIDDPLRVHSAAGAADDFGRQPNRRATCQRVIC